LVAAVRREYVTDAREQVRRRRSRIIRRLLRWGRNNSREFDWRDVSRHPYDVLIAEILLKRTTSTAAARLYPLFLRQFPSVDAIAEAPMASLQEALKPVGLYRQRAQGLKALAEYLCDAHGGEIPSTVTSLEKVPHAGPYVARAVSSFAFGRRAAIVDSNVARILRRLLRSSLDPTASDRALQKLADELLPNKEHRLFNYAMLDLGATICRYVRPRCRACPLRPTCDYGQAN